MKGSRVAFDTVGGRPAAARIVDGRLEDLLIDAPDDRIVPGTIYRARVGRPLKGQGGAIVETPDGALFLRQAKGLGQGDSLLVQTSTFAEPGKATPATTRLLFKSRFVLVTPGAEGTNIARSIRDDERRVELRELLSEISLPDGMGLVLRTASADGDDQAIVDDVSQTIDIASKIMSEPLTGSPEKLLDGPTSSDLAWRDWPQPDVTDADPGSFSRHGILDVIDSLAGPAEPLPGGGAMYIEPTRALTAVDVNTGGDTTPAAGLKANLAAAAGLPRALRLRGLGGQIVLDLAPAPKRDRRQIEQALTRAFRADPIETALVGWTPLGHMELQRKRERLPLSESLK
ncbi:MAG: ribonuclease G [Rhodobacteraceae bacterium]|nr:MAG: ribonuclease G [Paracoccaceae bacterium]